MVRVYPQSHSIDWVKLHWSLKLFDIFETLELIQVGLIQHMRSDRLVLKNACEPHKCKTTIARSPTELGFRNPQVHDGAVII